MKSISCEQGLLVNGGAILVISRDLSDGHSVAQAVDVPAIVPYLTMTLVPASRDAI